MTSRTKAGDCEVNKKSRTRRTAEDYKALIEAISELSTEDFTRMALAADAGCGRNKGVRGMLADKLKKKGALNADIFVRSALQRLRGLNLPVLPIEIQSDEQLSALWLQLRDRVSVIQKENERERTSTDGRASIADDKKKPAVSGKHHTTHEAEPMSCGLQAVIPPHQPEVVYNNFYDVPKKQDEDVRVKRTEVSNKTKEIEAQALREEDERKRAENALTPNSGLASTTGDVSAEEMPKGLGLLMLSSTTSNAQGRTTSEQTGDAFNKGGVAGGTGDADAPMPDPHSLGSLDGITPPKASSQVCKGSCSFEAACPPLLPELAGPNFYQVQEANDEKAYGNWTENAQKVPIDGTKAVVAPFGEEGDKQMSWNQLETKETLADHRLLSSSGKNQILEMLGGTVVQKEVESTNMVGPKNEKESCTILNDETDCDGSLPNLDPLGPSALSGNTSPLANSLFCKGSCTLEASYPPILLEEIGPNYYQVQEAKEEKEDGNWSENAQKALIECSKTIVKPVGEEGDKQMSWNQLEAKETLADHRLLSSSGENQILENVGGTGGIQKEGESKEFAGAENENKAEAMLTGAMSKEFEFKMELEQCKKELSKFKSDVDELKKEVVEVRKENDNMKDLHKINQMQLERITELERIIGAQKKIIAAQKLMIDEIHSSAGIIEDDS